MAGKGTRLQVKLPVCVIFILGIHGVPCVVPITALYCRKMCCCGWKKHSSECEIVCSCRFHLGHSCSPYFLVLLCVLCILFACSAHDFLVLYTPETVIPFLFDYYFIADSCRFLVHVHVYGFFPFFGGGKQEDSDEDSEEEEGPEDEDSTGSFEDMEDCLFALRLSLLEFLGECVDAFTDEGARFI